MHGPQKRRREERERPSQSTHSCKENMDEMESDMVLEVLDTPDRLARPVTGEVNPSSSDRKLGPSRLTYARRCRDFGGLHDTTGSSSAPDDTDFLFRQARLARMISEPSPQSQDTPHKLAKNGVHNELGNNTETIEWNENISFSLSHSTRCRDARRKTRKGPCSEIGSDESRGDSGLLSVGSSRPTRLVSRSGTVISLKPPADTSHVERASLLDGGAAGLNCRGKGKGIDLSSDSQPRTEPAPSRSLQLDAPWRNMGQRRLVRNGCISPSNIAKNNIAWGKNVAEAKEDEAGNMVVGKLPNGISSHPIHIVSPDCEGSCANKKKKKVIPDDNEVTGGQHAKFSSSRECSTLGKEVTVIADMDDNTVRSEDICWRTAYNSSDKSQEIATGHRGYVNVVHDCPEINALQHGSNLSSFRVTSEPDSESKREKLFRGKRKYSSTHSPIDECSGSILDDSEISYLPSSSQPSNPKSTSSRKSQRRGIVLGPVIEVDELHSPEVVCNNPRKLSSRVSDDSSVRAIQVESDEILARQLQEQYYNETPVIRSTEEIDANIAWVLQQEEDARRSFTARQDQFHRRDASLNARPRNSSVRSTNRARLPTSTRMAQLRRSFNRPMMDSEMRLNFLEAMEAALDNSNATTISNRVLRVQRDFNENDYEMLLALDDNNQHGGASERQINSLPQSVIETDNVEEACTVCLEPPVIGDTIRHLPCLHKFHKECIDTWLRRRRSCPICKSDIT